MINPRENPSPTPKSARVMAACLLVFTLVGAFFAGLFPIRSSNDPWWHLKTGEYLWNYFLEHGFAFPAYDVFTYTGASTPWVNHEWLGEVVFYWAYAIGGLQGAIILKSLILALTFGLLILYMYRNGVSWKLACLGSLIALLTAQHTIYLRPFVFTYLFIVIFLHLILYLQWGEHVKKAFVALVLGEILWINLHGGGIIGIVLIGILWFSEVWTCLLNWLKENPTKPSFERAQISTVTLLCVSLASLINPSGYHVHLLPFIVSGDPVLVANIGELAQPIMKFSPGFEIIILGLFALLMMRAGNITVFEGVTILFFGHQALHHMRHMPLFALVAVPPLMSAIAEERRALLPPNDDHKTYTTFWGRLYSRIVWALQHHLDVLLIYILVAYFLGWHPGGVQKIWHRNARDIPTFADRGYYYEGYPVKACDFILYNKIPGRMFNHDNFAGYLIWRLSPEYAKVWTDTRYDLWGSKYMKEELGVLRVSSLPAGFYNQVGTWYDWDAYKRVRGISMEIQTREDIAYLLENDPFLTPEFVDEDFFAWYESGKPYWKYVLDKYDVNYIIMYGSEYISRYLKNNYAGWVLIYENPNPNQWYTIHMRNTAGNYEYIKKHGKNHEEHWVEE